MCGLPYTDRREKRTQGLRRGINREGAKRGRVDGAFPRQTAQMPRAHSVCVCVCVCTLSGSIEQVLRRRHVEVDPELRMNGLFSAEVRLL